MSLIACKCGDGVGNSGAPGCQTLFGVHHIEVFIPTYDNDGVKNYLDLTALQVAIDAGTELAFFTALANKADKSQRWYPSLPMKDVEFAREDPNFQTHKDGSETPISQGSRKFKGFTMKSSPIYQMQFDSYPCNDMAVIKIDRNGNLRGKFEGTSTTKLYPVEITSFYTKYMDATADANVPMVEFNYTMEQTEKDSNWRVVTAASMGNVDLTTFKGLLDVNLVVSAESTTSFIATLTYDYGGALGAFKVEGMDDTDFSLYNNTDSAPVTILTAVESPAGSYLVTYGLEDSTDVLQMDGLKDGFDFAPFADSLITIP